MFHLLPLCRDSFVSSALHGALALVLVLFLPLGASAQQPADSFAPRLVTQLARVPEPPGGLVPFPVGKLWGYADTTGRLVIRPCFSDVLLDTAIISQTVFFTNGFALLPPTTRLVDGLAPLPEAGYRALILNARGEMLRVRWSEAALLLPDGSLQRVPRWQAYGQWEWGNAHPFDGSNGFSAGGPVRIVPGSEDEPSHPATDSLYYEASLLGTRRGVRADLPLTDAFNTNIRLVPRTQGLFALTDLQGQLLTAYAYARIDTFHEGRARALLPRYQPGRRMPRSGSDRMALSLFVGASTCYVDTLGHRLALPPLKDGSVFRHGRAVVVRDSLTTQYAIIDVQGRYQLPWQEQQLSEPDEAGFVRLLSKSTDKVCYVPPPGRKGFYTRWFDRAGPFRQGRAWAQQGDRQGLLDETGRWLTPVPYEQLITPRQLRSYPDDAQRELMAESSGAYLFGDDWPVSRRGVKEKPSGQPGAGPQYPAADAAYLVARRQGRYGVVARRTGREVVRARYDSVLFNPCRGIACLQRSGRAYVVAVATGRELIAGNYEGIDFITPHGRLLYLTRSAPAAWALADTTGRLHTPWLVGTGYPTPGGWLLSHESENTWTLRDSTGHLGLSSPFPLRQPLASAVWERVQWEKEGHLPGADVAAAYWRVSLPGGLARSAAGPGYVMHDPQHLRFLDANLREVGRVAAAGTQVLLYGWAFRQGELVTDRGLVLPSTAAPWLQLYFFDYARAWRTYGVLPTARGYRTRGGRNLWL